MTCVRVITVDDEPLALRRLKHLLHGMPLVDHVGEAAGCAEALAKIAALKPDLVLLDIKMRDGSGFEVAEAAATGRNPPAIVFVSAFDQFAVHAFEWSVADYLLKPVERERLAKAIDKAAQQLRANDAERRVVELQQIVRNLRAARHEQEQSPFETEFWIRKAGGIVRVSVDAIDCVSSEDEYVAIHTATGSHLMRGSIRQFEAKIEPGLFVRVHRRWLAKQSAIAELSAQRIGKPEVILRDGRRLPTGRVYLKQLRQVIRNAPRFVPPTHGISRDARVVDLVKGL